MKVFVQIAFDLEKCKQMQYDTIEKCLHCVGLNSTVKNVDGNLLELPRNTFAGSFESQPSCAAAIEHVRQQLSLATMVDFEIEGYAFITASPFESTVFAGHNVE